MIRIFWYKDSRLQDRNLRKAIRLQVTEKILKNQLGLSNEQTLTINRHERGKPYLPAHPGLHFNQSDSGEWMVIGTASSEIGIDIEKIRPRPYDALLNRWFLPEERLAVEAVQRKQPEKSLTEFIRLWTCKESILKYIGCGLGPDMSLHPVLSEIEDMNGKRIPYGEYLGKKLCFFSRILPLCSPYPRLLEYQAAEAEPGDFILSLCCECTTPPPIIQEQFLPEILLNE